MLVDFRHLRPTAYDLTSLTGMFCFTFLAPSPLPDPHAKLLKDAGALFKHPYWVYDLPMGSQGSIAGP